MRPSFLLAVVAGAVLPALGCSSFRAANEPLARWDPATGYRAARVVEERGLGDVLVMLAFSGGGTRAAALSYGVLQELRDTPIEIDGRRRRLLDEVDSISSVSGGSFTSAYYGLHGDRIFEDYEERFLRRDVEGELLLGLLNPLEWFRFASSFFDRSDMAVRLYDEDVFQGATFADLEAAGGPLLQINATDLAAGHHFTFSQGQFDFLCSDLAKLPLARAVTASSAVPGLFSPIVLENYAGNCGFEPPAGFDEALQQRRTDPRRFRVATILNGYLDPRTRPYVHLLDGGISDNIGLRVPLENVILAGGPAGRLQQVHAQSIRRVLVIVVNAEVHPPPQWDLAAVSPGLATILGAVTDTQIYAFNFETIELMRESLRRWARELPPGPGGEPIPVSLVTVDFERIEDARERAFFEAVPTSLSLPEETVARLVAVARRLLRESPEMRELVAEIGAPPQEGGAPASR